MGSEPGSNQKESQEEFVPFRAMERTLSCAFQGHELESGLLPENRGSWSLHLIVEKKVQRGGVTRLSHTVIVFPDQ